MAIVGIDHVVMRVKDLDAGIANYEKLGMKLEKTLETEGIGKQAIFRFDDGTFIELVQPTDPASPVGAALEKRGEGVHTVDGVPHTINMYELKKKLFLCMNSVNALEAIRFYVSFACTFAFAERKLMEGNSKIIRLIARDENLHLSSTQHILNLWARNKDDPEMAQIAEDCKEEARAIFMNAVEQEKEWADYLFQNGSMIGLNKEILCSYVEYIANQRMTAIGLDAPFDISSNPLPWMNNYLNSDNVQVAPQESEISSYLVGQIDSAVSEDDFADFEL